MSHRGLYVLELGHLPTGRRVDVDVLVSNVLAIITLVSTSVVTGEVWRHISRRRVHQCFFTLVSSNLVVTGTLVLWSFMLFTSLAPDLQPFTGGSLCDFVSLLWTCSPTQVEGLCRRGATLGEIELRGMLLTCTYCTEEQCCGDCTTVLALQRLC